MDILKPRSQEVDLLVVDQESALLKALTAKFNGSFKRVLTFEKLMPAYSKMVDLRPNSLVIASEEYIEGPYKLNYSGIALAKMSRRIREPGKTSMYLMSSWADGHTNIQQQIDLENLIAGGTINGFIQKPHVLEGITRAIIKHYR